MYKELKLMPSHSSNMVGDWFSVNRGKRGNDGIILRGPVGDPYVRRVEDGKIDYEPWMNRPLFNLPEEAAFDGPVKDILEDKQPTLSKLVKSTVQVRIVKKSSVGEASATTLASGVLIRKDLVLTCQHSFRIAPDERIDSIEVRYGSEIIEPTKETIPVRILDEVEPANLQSGDIPMFEPREEAYLDAAILRLHSNLPIDDDDLLKVPVAGKCNEDAVLCCSGYPGMPANESKFTECLTRSFLNLNRKLDEQSLEDFAEDIYAQTWGNMQSQVCSFGARTKDPHETKHDYFCATSISTCFGLSGAPVVDVSAPDELFGIVSWGIEGSSSNMILKIDSKAVKALLQHFLQSH